MISLVEKPAQPKSNFALAGVYMFTPAVHEAVRQLRPSARGELEITEAIQWLIDNGRKVKSTIITEYWKDTGNVTDMLEVNRRVLETLESRRLGEVDASSELIGRVAIEAPLKQAPPRRDGAAAGTAGRTAADQDGQVP